MNKNFLLFCVWLTCAGVTAAAFIGLLTFVLFSLGDSIFVTGVAL